ncbi:MAG: ArnT family glycosyltransferase [Deltaproteobacteria bacterium]
MPRAETIADSPDARSSGDLLHDWLPWLLTAAVTFILLNQLGSAALFEPDEGRNAEKAREILVLNDWVTPHENFYPVLDKPIFFYWLIAVSYKLFGVSEWTARLPSFLSALGCVVLVYRFARSHWGRWAALWSALVLVTSVEFFVLARIVIFDMPLTFFGTVALLAFYEAQHSENRRRRAALWLAMYLALAVGTLIKGLVALVIPGMVCCLFILLRRRWHVLRRMYLVPGIGIFIAVVLPWYLQAEARNPGYLYYFLWAEHLGRYTTATFDRSEPWYYFIVVALIGFFPWTLLLPWMIKNLWHRSWDDKTLYLVIWVCVPLLFFSTSNSKLPHYILPIFPAVAILAGATVVSLCEKSAAKLRIALSLVWVVQTANGLYLLFGSFYPRILAHQIRGRFIGMAEMLWVYAIGSLLILGYMATRSIHDARVRPSLIYLAQLVGLGVFLVFFTQMMVSISPDRSAKTTALAALAQLRTGAQVVFFETYMSGMPFYLHSERPIWLITHDNKKRTFLGNYHVIGKRQDPLTPWGKAIFNLDDFREQWKTRKQPLLVIVKEKNFDRLVETVGEALNPVATIDEYFLVTNR